MTASDIDRLKLSIDKWGMALVNELQLLREAFVANNMSICESCANNPCNKKAMLGDRRIYECTLYERAEQTEPQKNMAEDIVESFGFKTESYRQAKAKTEPQTITMVKDHGRKQALEMINLYHKLKDEQTEREGE